MDICIMVIDTVRIIANVTQLLTLLKPNLIDAGPSWIDTATFYVLQ